MEIYLIVRGKRLNLMFSHRNVDNLRSFQISDLDKRKLSFFKLDRVLNDI